MRVLQLGTRCNNACVFCAAAVERERAVPERAIETLLEAAAGAGGDSLAIVGGEPTLYENLFDCVRRSKEHGASRVVVQTNARRLAYASYAQTLSDCGVDALDVSLHGSTEPMHDYHTCASGSFKQTVRGAANAVGAGIEVVVSCVVTRSNFRNLSEIVQTAKTMGARAVRFQAPRLSGRALAARDRIMTHPELVGPYLHRAMSFGRRSGIAVIAGSLERGGTSSDFVPFIADQVDVSASAERSTDGRAAPPCRANPGRAERRVRDHRTGSELRNILPALFEPVPGGR